MNAIYQPKGRAFEYAPYACNLYEGCGHGCKYCYVGTFPWNKGKDLSSPVAREGIIDALVADAKNLDEKLPRGKKARRDYPVLLCFTTDPYNAREATAELMRRAITILGSYRLSVSILTKNPYLACRDFDLMKTYDVQFGVSMSFASDTPRAKWEPKAAPIDERIRALYEASQAGIRTFVSVEPVISQSQALQVVEMAIGCLGGCVKEWRIGKLNHEKELLNDLRDSPYHAGALHDLIAGGKEGWAKFARKVASRLQFARASYYLKVDLLECLPESERKALQGGAVPVWLKGK